MTAERPILFSGPMIRAILAGQKNVTRRVVKPQPGTGVVPYNTSAGAWNWVIESTGVGTRDPFPCPFGARGEKLWVRETWQEFAALTEAPAGIAYRADSEIDCCGQIEVPPGGKFHRTHRGWTPSIHMPRWASRISLEITGVTIERLQDITEEQALAEGTPCWVCGRTIDGLSENDCECFHSKAARASFEVLWDSINGKRLGCSWKDNPWLWAISFRRVLA